MQIKWTSKSQSDLTRLYDFLLPVNATAAARTVLSLVSAPSVLLTNPRVGEKLEEFETREVRKMLIGHYEMRYEIQSGTVYILRIWHTREDR